MAPFSHTSSHHSPSPHPLTIPPHLFLHHPSLPLLITPVTSINTTPPYLTPHYSPSLHPLITPLTTPHHPFSPPLLNYLPSSPHLLTTPPHHTSSPHLLTTPLLTLLWLITYLPHHTPSPPSSVFTPYHHVPPLKGTS